LPKLSEQAEVYADYRTTGLSLKGHPIGFHREALSQLRVLRACELATAENERVIKVAGIVLIRQRPATAKGITFVTLEDETGVANLIVRPEVWNRFYTICKTTAAWIATGKLERHSGVINILTFRIDDLTLRIGELKTKSCDFR
jgi:error-prone DNA polymerase